MAPKRTTQRQRALRDEEARARREKRREEMENAPPDPRFAPRLMDHLYARPSDVGNPNAPLRTPANALKPVTNESTAEDVPEAVSPSYQDDFLHSTTEKSTRGPCKTSSILKARQQRNGAQHDSSRNPLPSDSGASHKLPSMAEPPFVIRNTVANAKSESHPRINTSISLDLGKAPTQQSDDDEIIYVATRPVKQDTNQSKVPGRRQVAHTRQARRNSSQAPQQPQPKKTVVTSSVKRRRDPEDSDEEQADPKKMIHRWTSELLTGSSHQFQDERPWSLSDWEQGE
ncbi:hypothetical protein F5Y16DRAFT_401256 [Xylariaceae sp. FL0255]|nr:hypothetical protein F5Y16DRAFT_401256 [Xylariaceae sp. FL0255]